MQRPRRRAITPGRLLAVAAIAIVVPALAGGIWSVTGDRSFRHGVKVMAVFNVILLVVIVGAVVVLAHRDVVRATRR
jgi:hypothetical protein